MLKKLLEDKLSSITLHCEKRLDEIKKDSKGYLESNDVIENNTAHKVYTEILSLINETPNNNITEEKSS